MPPANVWFDVCFLSYCLELIKAMCGLVDAPLLWQLCLRWHLKRPGATTSLCDDNFHFWVDTTTKALLGELTSHVDDCNSAGKRAFLDWLRTELEAAFGNMSVQQLPMDHVGICYEPVCYSGTPGVLLHQEKFSMALATIPLDPVRNKNPDFDCIAAEQTALRGSLGGLFFLCSTRSDLIADVIGLQTHICSQDVAPSSG